MSLGDCPKCWDNPCACGYGYEHYTEVQRLMLGSAVLNVDRDQLAQILADMPSCYQCGKKVRYLNHRSRCASCDPHLE